MGKGKNMKGIQKIMLLTAAFSVYAGITAFAASTLHVSGDAKMAQLTDTDASGKDTGTIQNSDNFPSQPDNTARTVYYFGGNAFYGLHRSGTSEFGESYKKNTWLLEDTDAMWDGNYLYSQFGNNSYPEDTGAEYVESDENKKYYYQTILTYGEGLFQKNAGKWFTTGELSAVTSAAVTSTLGYRTYERPVHDDQNNYMLNATRAILVYGYVTRDNIADSLVSDYVKMFYSAKPTDSDWDAYYISRNDKNIVDAKTGKNVVEAEAIKNYPDNNVGINENSLNIRASNVYSVIDAHLYAPSLTEWVNNPSIFSQIQKNVSSEYAVRSQVSETVQTKYHNGNGYPAAQTKEFA